MSIDKHTELPHRIRAGLWILGACIGLFGIIGNITAFIGFQKQNKNTSTSFLFKSLAIADTFVIVTTNLTNLQIYLDSYIKHHYFALGKTIFEIRNMAILSSNGITVLLTVTRFIAVCFPLKTVSVCSIKRVRYYLVATLMFSIVCFIPDIVITRILITNQFVTHEEISISSYLRYLIVFEPLVVFVIPLLIITSLTIILIIKLKFLNTLRQTTIRANRHRNNATKVLIVVNIVFIVCTLPWPVTYILHYSGYTKPACIISETVSTFHNVNSSLNFLIYMLFSKQYREVVKQNCMCFHRGEDCDPIRENIQVGNGGQRMTDQNIINRETRL